MSAPVTGWKHSTFMTLIYKIVPETLWRRAEAEGVFRGAPVDMADGFIHFSTADQAEETARRHFAGQDGLLLAAFEDGNPVLFLEHKFLYRWAKGSVPAGRYTLPIGEAQVVRAGRHATVVAWGVAVHWALEAAGRLAEQGTQVEVVDLRSLLPWDVARVVDSVRRTGRCLVLHEAPTTGGHGAEVAATIGREAFEWLDAPVTRVAGLDMPVPFSRALEEIFLPKHRLLPALRSLLEY